MNSMLRWLWLAPVAAVLATGAAPARPVMAQQKWTDLYLTVLPFGHRPGIKAGEDNRFFLEIRNAGNASVENVRLSSDHPAGWTVEFGPAEVPAIGPGAVVTVDVTVRPPANASGGQTQITLIATAGQLRKAEVLTVDVGRASFWLWVVAGVAAAIVVVFVGVYLRIGRRGKVAG